MGPRNLAPPPPSRGRPSEVKLVDIILRENKGLTEKDVVPFDLECLEAPRRERRIAGLKGPGTESGGRVDREIAEIHGVPQDDAIGDPFVNVSLIVVGQTQADDLH